MRFITLGVYMVIFWVAFCLVRAITIIVLVLRVDRVALALRGKRRRRRVLYLAAFFPGNAGYEGRVRSWAQVLRQNGFDTKSRWCLDRQRFEDLLHHSGVVVGFHLAVLIRRIWQCLEAPGFDAVIVRRELLLFNDYGGLFMERLLLALNRNVALDFDDDISVAKREPRPIGVFGRLMLESGSKFDDCLKLYPRFIVGSSYLASKVRSRNPVLEAGDIAVVPTCVDTADYPLKRYAAGGAERGTAFGWVGSVGNLKQLDLVIPALEVLSREQPLKLIVISGEPFQRTTSFEIVSAPWSYDTQGTSLNLIDVGLMPLCDGPEERGKCGFKLIQYMACGIVSIGSAVTTNIEIIEHGLNGFLVWKQGDWDVVLREVLAQKDRFEEIGRNARRTVASRYTFCANQARYVEFVKRLCEVSSLGEQR